MLGQPILNTLAFFLEGGGGRGGGGGWRLCAIGINLFYLFT